MTFLTVKKYSLERRMLILLTLALLFLITLLLTINFYTISRSNEKIVISNQRSMDFSLNQIERGLSDIDEMLMNLAATSPEFASLMASPNELQAHLASHELAKRLQDLSRAYGAADAYFIYSHNNDSFRDNFSDNYTYEDKLEIRSWLKEVVRINRFSHKDGWVTRNIAGSYYTMRFFGGRGTYLVALTSAQTLGDVAFFSDEKIDLLFTTETGNIVSSDSTATGLRLNVEDSYYYDKQAARIVMQDRVPKTDLRLFLSIPNSGYWHGLSPLHLILLLISLASILLLPLALMWIRVNISKPLNQVQQTILAIRRGAADVRSPDSRIREFHEISKTFNAMMQQIRDLKIESYEHQIQTQQAQLQYLQLQIRPHFYLNVLKGLYAVAEQDDKSRIQEMILAFSGHLRYIFRDQMGMVSLREEIDHIRNYIDIQRLFSAKKPICHIAIEESLLNYPIPPLTLATFVENSIKHQSEDQIFIWIKGKRMEVGGQAFLMLSVEDNGKGFSDQILKKINLNSGRRVYTEGHVGINNIRHRFRLIYGEKAMLAFYNGGRGPVSEIYLPM